MRGPPSPASTRRASPEAVLLPAIGALFLFGVSFDDGGYSLASRGTWAIAVWWTLALAAAAGWWRPRLRGATGFVAALLAALAVVTLASAGWAANDARSFSEFNRVALYLGVFLLASAAAPHARLGRWCDAIAVALCAVAIVSLLSRFLPDTISDRGLSEAIPATAKRLSYPVGYWNGLAILVALALPLLLHGASAARETVPRALAVAPIPALAATIYFASSRGGFGTAAIGAAAFLVLGRDRWSIAGALVAAAGGSAVVLVYLASNPAVANEPLTAGAAERLEAALVVMLGCVVAGVLQAVFSRLLRRRRVSRPVSVAAGAAALVLVAAAVAATDPAERFAEFKQPPAPARATDDPIRAHLVSFGGSGRWQLWESSVEAWGERPLAGHGAGSFEAWWTEHGSLPLFVRDAHSLYLETLAELGVLGFVLLIAAIGVGLGAALARLGTVERSAEAALTAAVVAFAAAAAIDWVWELPAVTLVAVGCLALVLASPRSVAARGDALARAGMAVVALALVAAQAIPLLADATIRDSRAAAAGGDLPTALADADRATAIQPWAPDPWLQLALVREQGGQLEPAGAAIERATAEDDSDWRLWLVSARIHTKLGEIDAARRALARARTLNPRSFLFIDLRRR